MSLTAFAIIAAVMLSAVMTLAWAAVRGGAKSGWIDAVWTFSIGAAGVAAALAPVEGWEGDALRGGIVAALAAAWSLRLGLHIAMRTAKGGEDPRYASLKEEWGDKQASRLFWFLQIQAAAAFILVATLFFSSRNPTPSLDLTDWLALAVFAAAIAGEAVADAQLSRFRGDPSNKGKVCDVGLWGLSRHPNYFFEWLVWVGFALFALDPGGGYPAGWLALGGPILIYWLLVHVSGIPPLEAHMLRSRGEAFRAYQARVNAFWPGPAKTAPSRTEEERQG